MEKHRNHYQSGFLVRFSALAGAVLMLAMVGFFNAHLAGPQIPGPAQQVAQADDGAGLERGLAAAHAGAHCQTGASCGDGLVGGFTLPVAFKITDQPRVNVPGWAAFSQLNGLFRPPRLRI